MKIGITYTLQGYVELDIENPDDDKVIYKLHNVDAKDLINGLEGMPEIDADAIELVKYSTKLKTGIVIGQ